jgi:hypothetical protein
VVFTASGMTQANIILGRLTTEDIPTRIKYDAAGPIYAITINGLGEVKKKTSYSRSSSPSMVNCSEICHPVGFRMSNRLIPSNAFA